MITIQTRVVVDDEGIGTLKLPMEVPPGEHAAVVVIEGNPVARKTPIMAGFPRHEVQVDLPADFTFRREELYDDSGRGT